MCSLKVCCSLRRRLMVIRTVELSSRCLILCRTATSLLLLGGDNAKTVPSLKYRTSRQIRVLFFVLTQSAIYLQLASWRNSCDVSLLPHDLTLRVLVKYHDKYGDLVIPRRFTVELPKFSCSVWFSTVLALDILLWLLLSRNVLRE